jgi:hypothetical protein
MEARIADTRVANVADSVMYRRALASAAAARRRTVYWYDREQVFRFANAATGGKDVSSFLSAMGRSIGSPSRAQHRLAAAAAFAATMEP